MRGSHSPLDRTPSTLAVVGLDLHDGRAVRSLPCNKVMTTNIASHHPIASCRRRKGRVGEERKGVGAELGLVRDDSGYSNHVGSFQATAVKLHTAVHDSKSSPRDGSSHINSPRLAL